MLSKPEREQIIALIKREVVPAIGCTEPIAVALCVAKAREILGTEPEKVSARLSANILKNAMGVGIPGTGMIGLPIAIALGALVGRSEYQLEVLKDSDAKAVERGKRFIEQGRIDISLKEGITEKLYIEIEVSGGGHSAVAIIAGGHTNFVFISRDGETLQESRRTSGSEQEAQGVELNLRKVFDFAMTTPLDEIRFILEAKRLNKAAAEDSFKNNYGHYRETLYRDRSFGRRTLRCGDHRRRAYEFRLHFTGRRNASGESSYLRQRTGGAGRRTQPAQSV